MTEKKYYLFPETNYKHFQLQSQSLFKENEKNTEKIFTIKQIHLSQATTNYHNRHTLYDRLWPTIQTLLFLLRREFLRLTHCDCGGLTVSREMLPSPTHSSTNSILS